jgi:hypothetical protein
MSPHNAHPLLPSHDDTHIAWQQACVQAADALHPQHDHERLAKALALAHDGAVRIEDDGDGGSRSRRTKNNDPDPRAYSNRNIRFGDNA